FTGYQKTPELLQQLRNNQQLCDGISPELWNAISKGVPVLLFFGQIKKAKGLEVFLEAIAQTKGEFIAVVAGKIRDDSWERYDDMITALNIRSHIIPVIRHISDEERDFLFAVSRSIVLPYTHIYQSGVLLMAMSFPLAAIASDLLPNQYLVHHRINGLLFKSGHADDLARQMETLIDEADFADRLRTKALMDIDAHYNPKRIGQLFAEILK
ncbi:MAG: glycosyltransferase, partial [Bacteroidia bacterium]